MQHIFAFFCIYRSVVEVMLKIIQKRITTTLKVNRIKSLDVMIFAARTICGHEYQLQLPDPFSLPSLLIIKGNFKNMKNIMCKNAQDLISGHIEWSQYSCAWEYRGENRTIWMCVGNWCSKFTSGWRIYKFSVFVPSINVAPLSLS